MSNLLDRPSFDVTLDDGRTCKIQRIGGSAHVEALRAAASAKHDDPLVEATESNVAYWSTICFHGLVDHGLENAAGLAEALSAADLRYISERIEFRTHMRDDPDKPAEQPAWDATIEAEGGEASTDPMVDEFPAPEHAKSASVGSDAVAVRDVSLPSVAAGSGGAGSAPVHGGEAGSSAEAPGAELGA